MIADPQLDKTTYNTAFIHGGVSISPTIPVLVNTVGQFIGLKDSTGVEMYVDDIVEGYWSRMRGDYLKKGLPTKIRKWFRIIFNDGKQYNAGFALEEICIHPDDRKAAEEHFYRSIQTGLREDRDFELKDNQIVWLGKNTGLTIIGNIHDNPELLKS